MMTKKEISSRGSSTRASKGFRASACARFPVITIESISAKIEGAAEALRRWARQSEIDEGKRDGTSTIDPEQHDSRKTVVGKPGVIYIYSTRHFDASCSAAVLTRG